MDSYEVIMTPDAINDITELRDYISQALLSPDVALSYIRVVRNEISTLSKMPKRYMVVEEEPWRSRGIRKFKVKNSYVYYVVNDSANIVYILNIIYAKRDQLKILAQIDI